MNNNKTEIFKNLLEEFQKLKNLEAKHPTLQSEFNNIVNQSTLQKIAALIQKQQAKTLASKEHVVAMRGVNMQAEEMEEPLLKDGKELKDRFTKWVNEQHRLLIKYKGNTSIINISTIKDAIIGNKTSIKGFVFLEELNNGLLSICGDESHQSINDISQKFANYLLEPKFTKKVEAFFKDNKKDYKHMSPETFQSYLINLAGYIEEAKNNYKTEIDNYKKWYASNQASLINLIGEEDNLGLVHTNLFLNYMRIIYSNDCSFVIEPLTKGINKDNMLSIRSIGETLIDNFEEFNEQISEDEKRKICYLSDSITLGSFVKHSIIKNYQPIRKIFDKSRAESIHAFNLKENPLIDMTDLEKRVLDKLDKSNLNVWTYNLLIKSIDPLLYKDYKLYKSYIECKLDFQLGLENVSKLLANLCVDYTEATLPDTIPFSLIVDLIKDSQVSYNINNIYNNYENWVASNWYALSTLKISDSSKIHKATLLNHFKLLFSADELNLKYTWFKESFLASLENDNSSNDIEWSSIKEKFADTSIIDKYKSFLKTQVDSLIKEGDIHKIFMIEKNWNINFPTANELNSAVFSAKNYYNSLKPKAQELDSNPVTITLVVSEFNVSLEVLLYISTKLEYRKDGTAITTGVISKYDLKILSKGKFSGFNLWEIDSQFENNITHGFDGVTPTSLIMIPIRWQQNKTDTSGLSIGANTDHISVAYSMGREYSTDSSNVIRNKVKFSVVPITKNDIPYMRVSVLASSEHHVPVGPHRIPFKFGHTLSNGFIDIKYK